LTERNTEIDVQEAGLLFQVDFDAMASGHANRRDSVFAADIEQR
jgi:hypothetical protein